MPAASLSSSEIEKLLTDSERLIHFLAHRATYGQDVEDIASVIRIHFLSAVGLFDPSKHAGSFGTFAGRFAIHKARKYAIRDHNGGIHIPCGGGKYPRRLGRRSLDAPLGCDSTVTLGQMLPARESEPPRPEQPANFWDVVAHRADLNNQERTVLEQRFINNATFTQIATALDIRTASAKAIFSTAMNKIYRVAEELKDDLNVESTDEGVGTSSSRESSSEVRARMTLLQLQHFVAIVEAGTMTHAATKLGIGQPVLSDQIRRLESTDHGIGRKLFTRGKNGMSLTAAGRALLPRAKALLALAAEAHREVAAVSE